MTSPPEELAEAAVAHVDDAFASLVDVQLVREGAEDRARRQLSLVFAQGAWAMAVFFADLAQDPDTRAKVARMAELMLGTISSRADSIGALRAPDPEEAS